MQQKEKEASYSAGKDVRFSSEQQYADEAEAKSRFERSKEKLFHVDGWSDLPGISSTFLLHDGRGNRKEGGSPVEGDHLKILLPGPFPENWVKVIHVFNGADAAEFTVTPCSIPEAEGEEGREIKHFFTEDATSRFRVERSGNVIRAWEIGRNESINNKGEEAGARKVINTLIATGGWAGFQKLQWQKLTDFLVHKIEVEGS